MSEQITTAEFTNGVGKKESEESEVVARAQFGRFSAKYELCIFVEADQCTKPRELEALRRGVGI